MTEELYDESGPEPMIRSAGFAMLIGIPVDEFIAEVDRQRGGAFVMPEVWLKASRRRSKEYQAATGRTDMRGAIDYFAARAAEESTD